MSRLRTVLLLSLFWLSGCASMGNSGFYGGTAQARMPAGLADQLVVIYNHGSLSEDKRDPCIPESSFLPGGMPDVIRDLAGSRIAGKEVMVYALCSDIPGRLKLSDNDGNLKIRLRVTEIAQKVQEFRAAGVPGEQIFLAGHSAGGWASLLIEREQPQLVNAVIAFAPAFSGMKHNRNATWQGFRNKHQRHLSEGRGMRALVYAFPSDPYNSPAELAFFSRIPEIEFRPLTLSRNVADKSCYRGHRAVFRRCFAQQHSDELRAYIERNLGH